MNKDLSPSVTQRRQRRAQGLVEFALILPVLLFMIMGILDFGRALFTYAQASAQLRSALRMASVVGLTGKTYVDCDGMRSVAQGVFFAEAQPTVVIQYYTAAGYTGAAPVPFATVYPSATKGGVKYCEGASGNPYNLTSTELADIKNGDILHIEEQVSVRMITPFFPPLLTFTLKGQRTVVTNITLVNSNYLDTPLPPAMQTANELTAQYYYTQNALITPGTPSSTVPQVTNLTRWIRGSRCAGRTAARFMGLIWDKIPNLGTTGAGYFIYAGGTLVGKTTDGTGNIHQCGLSVSRSRNRYISGCFNITRAPWDSNPAGTPIAFTVAGFINNGSTPADIGPQSVPFVFTCK